MNKARLKTYAPLAPKDFAGVVVVRASLLGFQKSMVGWKSSPAK
jgi:hypothetical protein